MGNPYGPRTLVWVTPFTGSTIKFGFMTNADGATQTALGHVPIAGAYPSALVIGANAPKPPRASRLRATGVESSFVDAEAIATARAADWKISAGKQRNGASSAKSKTVYIVHETNKIAWKMPTFLHTKISTDLTALGIAAATATDLDLIFGVRYPKLPRVAKINVPTTGAASRYTTYCDPSKLDNLPAGWTTVRASQDAF
ncbi:MAG: hypothetical protein IGS48_02435 [Oscillatoriales cyanobacterium C42_A2020_001]|nr:hypothetical protein [Leptolyngbyaceae cyanobacterium C42_A2020_001]